MTDDIEALARGILANLLGRTMNGKSAFKTVSTALRAEREKALREAASLTRRYDSGSQQGAVFVSLAAKIEALILEPPHAE